MKKVILDLCGGTGSWSKFYRENDDYHVIIVDPDGDPQDNAEVIKQDVRLYVPPKGIHGVLAAPPCTHLTGSGARWWAGKGEEALLEALSIVDACLRVVAISNPVWWALENPVGRLGTYLGRPDLVFHPYHFGEPFLKRTCLWGHFTMPIQDIVKPTGGSEVLKLWPGPERAKLRSKTYLGFAKAFYESNR